MVQPQLAIWYDAKQALHAWILQRKLAKSNVLHALHEQLLQQPSYVQERS